MSQQLPGELAFEEKTLSASELLAQVFEALVSALSGKEIKLAKPVFAEIADDSDWHRIKKGYSRYERAFLISLETKEWILSFGQACGDYPADPYNCDISVIPFNSEGKDEGKILAEVPSLLEGNEYFENCLVGSLSYGALFWAKKYGAIVELPLQVGMNKFIAKESEINPEVFHLDFRPVRSPTLYKPGALPYLVEVLKSALG